MIQIADAIKPALQHVPVPAPQREGEETPSENATCSKHGRSYRRVERRAGFEYAGTCPDCFEEQKARDAAAHVEELRRSAERGEATKRQAALEASLARAGIPSRYRDLKLSTFPVERAGGNAVVVVEACRGYVNRWEQVRKRGTCMILMGAPGRGKTGLACAIANTLMRQHAATAAFMTAYGAVRHQRDTWGRKGRSESEALADLVDPDLLILDDVGAQIGGDSEMLMLFEVLNGRYSERRPTILLSNLPMEDCPATAQRAAVSGLRSFLGHRIIDRMLDDDAVVQVCSWTSLRGSQVRADED